MGSPVTDQRNPGARRVQKYSVTKGYSASHVDSLSNAETKGVGFAMLKNCLVDKRLGGLVRRPGSLTETITTGLGIPLGMGEYLQPASSTYIPMDRAFLVNFAGARWFEKFDEVWTELTLHSSVTNQSATRQSSMVQLGGHIWTAAGLPSRWQGPGFEMYRMGLPAPSAATITSYNTGTGITLTDGTRYVITCYDSTSGLESDWSEPSTLVPAITNKSIVIALPAAPTAGYYDKFRIYRYLDGGAFPYLVNTVPKADTSYTDTTPDASLTTRAARRYDHGLPPLQSFIVAKFAQCLWWVDASDPNTIRFSKPYIGSDNDLQYYPAENYVRANEPVTGLLVVPGKMLVFHPRSISYISGFSVDDFVFNPLIAGVGTLFHHSIATNGQEVVFLAEQGFVSMPPQGGPARHISREIDIELQSLVSTFYNQSIYISSAWSPSLRQFLWSITAKTTSPSNSLRVKIWGYSPEFSDKLENRWMEHTFAAFADSNGSGKCPVFCFHPSPSADTGQIQQPSTYIGYYDGGAGKILGAFRPDKTQDDGVDYTAEWLTQRLAPGEDNGGTVLFHELGFDSTYSDPTSDGDCTLKYVKDLEDPHLRNYSASLITISDTSLLKKLPQMQAKFIHLYGTDSSADLSKLLLSNFHIHYRERHRRES